MQLHWKKKYYASSIFYLWGPGYFVIIASHSVVCAFKGAFANFLEEWIKFPHAKPEIGRTDIHVSSLFNSHLIKQQETSATLSHTGYDGKHPLGGVWK